MKNKIDSIEELNDEIKELLNSKHYKLGKTLINYFTSLKEGHIDVVYKNFYDMLAQKRVAKNHYSPDNRNSDYNHNKYLELLNNKPKVVVYTCIVGNYDIIHEPLLKVKNVDYILFTDNEKLLKGNIETKWIIRKIPTEYLEKGPIIANRYYKMNPHAQFVDEYDYSIYIDGNIRLISDPNKIVATNNRSVKISMHAHRERNCLYEEAKVCIILKRGRKDKIIEQIKLYEQQNFPHNFGLMEANVICTKLNDDKAYKVLKNWWIEFRKSESFRDQLSFPYSVWKTGYSMQDIGCMGSNVFENRVLRINKHS